MTTLLRRCIPFLLLLCAPPLQAQLPPQYTGIDHVRIDVAELSRARDFYAKVFGAEVWKEAGGERRYLRLGQSYLALDQQADAGMERIALGIEHFDPAAAQRWLAAQGIPWRDAGGNGGDSELYVEDRDGIRTQLARAASWERVSAAATREALPGQGAPIFTAYAIDEVFMTVSNLEVDSLFYARLLDQTATQQAGALWFRIGSARLRLTQAPVGQQAGIAYFAVHVAFTDMEAAADAVFAAGGIIENILPNGFSFWDPDGVRVVVRSGDLY